MLNKLEEKLGKGRVRENIDLFAYMTLRAKVKALFFFEAATKEDLINAKKTCIESNLPFYVLGGGSNTVFLRSFEGLVVKNLYQKKEIVREDKTSVDLSVSSGYPVSKLVKETTEQGFSGFEYHFGLPGTVGGALYMNSKWTRPLNYFGDSLISAEIIGEAGEVRHVDRDYFEFGYDSSILQKTKEIVLDAVFRLKKTDKDYLKRKTQESLEYRKKTQPYGVFSSGCFYQNISEEEQKKHNLPTTSSGYLIDKAGLKGKRVGNYRISEKHANFVINEGDGKPEDLVKLLSIIKEAVREKFGIELKREVILV